MRPRLFILVHVTVLFPARSDRQRIYHVFIVNYVVNYKSVIFIKEGYYKLLIKAIIRLL